MVLFAIAVRAQQPGIHSHNDYSRPAPFYHAYRAQATAIEADVYLRDGKLLVAHDTAELSADRTLVKLYLEPIRKELASSGRAFDLLVDLKESYSLLMPVLLRELASLAGLLNDGVNDRPVRVVITGASPPPAEYTTYPSWIFFDDNLMRPHTDPQWARVAQVSLNFARFSTWKGAGVLPAAEAEIIRQMINAVHRTGKNVRFWGAPDTALAWQELLSLGADILNTDQIDRVNAFLKARRSQH